jgi:solute carrier family 25 folate transporter 32
MHNTDFVAGIVAGASTSLFLHPLDLVKVRFQVNDGSLPGVQYRSTLHAFRTIVHLEGVRGLFKGAVPGSYSPYGAYMSYPPSCTWEAAACDGRAGAVQ